MKRVVPFAFKVKRPTFSKHYDKAILSGVYNFCKV